MPTLEESDIFFKQLEKGQQRLNDAITSANNAQREQFNREISLRQQGLGTRVDPNTGQLSIFKMSPDENIIFQAQQETKQSLAVADQNLQNLLAGKQVEFETKRLESPEFKKLTELKGERRREEEAKDIQAKIDAEVAARESESGKKLSKLEKQEIVDKFEAEAKARARAAVLPEVLEAQRQQAINKLLIETSPEAIQARKVLIQERMANNLTEFEQKMRLQGQFNEEQIATQLDRTRAAMKEIGTFTNTIDIVQGSKIFESVFGLPPGTINPISAEEQIRAVGEAREESETAKAAAQSRISASLDPLIEAAFKAIDFDFTDLTDKRDIGELVSDDFKVDNLDKLITDIVSTTGFSEKQVAAAILAKLGIGITDAITDIEGGELFDTEFTEKQSIKKLKLIRSRLQEVKKSGLK